MATAMAVPRPRETTTTRAMAMAPPSRRLQIVIIDRDRDTVRTYYRKEFAAGNCPPGLAKKNNGCLPPGQANRAWVVGQSLPPEIVYQPMPRELWTQLTPPPAGYEYARVDDNIVLISTATRIIAGMLGNIGNFSDYFHCALRHAREDDRCLGNGF